VGVGWGGGLVGRLGLERARAVLEREVGELKRELQSYAQSDPVEIERKKKQTVLAKQEAEKWTDEIQSMESWLRDVLAGDRERLLPLLREVYGNEFDAEDETLKELPA
jgi:hypothetical protein